MKHRAGVVSAWTAIALAAAGSLTGTVAGAAEAGAGACHESCRKDTVDRYVDATLQKAVSQVPLAPGAVITENGLPVKLGDGVWKTAQKLYSTISSNQYVTDVQTGQVGFMGVLEDAGQPAM